MATAVTLDSVNSELKESNKKLKTIKDLTVDNLDYQLLSIETFEKGFFELTEFLKGNSLLQIEKDRELAEYNKDLIEAIQDIQVSPTQAQQDSSNMLLFLGNLKSLGIFAGIASVALGSAAGIISGYINNLKLIGKAIVGIVKMLTPTSLLTSIGNSIKSISTMFMSGIKLMSTTFMSGTSSVSKFFTSVGTFFSKALDFKPIKDAFIFITRVFNSISELVKTAMGMGEKVAKVNESVSKFSSAFGKVFSGVLKVVSKIFTPIITIFTTIMGAIEGFKAEGIIGLIKGAITGFFEGFIGGFLDIVKDLTSWVLGALGFNKAEKLLDSFSFNDLFKEFVNSIFGTVSDIFTGIIESFKAVGNSITTVVSDVDSFIKSILKNSLPIADKNKPWYSVNNLAAKAIPDAVYKFVGINSDSTNIPAPPVQELSKKQMTSIASNKSMGYTGYTPEVEAQYKKQADSSKLVVQQQEFKRAEQLGSQMNLAKQEGDQLKAQATSRSGNSTNNVSSNTVNNVNNSNTTVVKPAPSPGKRPSNVSDLIWSY